MTYAETLSQLWLSVEEQEALNKRVEARRLLELEADRIDRMFNNREQPLLLSPTAPINWAAMKRWTINFTK